MAETIRTERLLLRPWRSADRAPFARLNADDRVMQHFPSTLSPDQSHTVADRLQAHIDEFGWGCWAVDIPGITDFAGFIGLAQTRFEAHFTPCVEMAWRLDWSYWGRGYATEGARAALAYAFNTLQLPQVVSYTSPANERSIRVMQDIGLIHDPAGDFEHPLIPPGHRLRHHVLYRGIAPSRLAPD